MARIVIEVPEECKGLVPTLQNLVEVAGLMLSKTSTGRAVPYSEWERQIEAAAGEIERAAHKTLLEALDVDAPTVRIWNALYRQVGRYPTTFKTRTGPVVVERALYRQVGQRNAKTVDPVSLRAGVVGDGWLPGAAGAMAFLLAQGTSREAEATSRQLGRLPYSRSSFERVGHLVGDFYVGMQPAIDAELRDAVVLPAEARSVSVSLDRVSVPMEEPRARPVGRPRNGAAKNPCDRVFRMAYCGTVTLHDHNGDALHTVRLGCMPDGDVPRLCEALGAEVKVLLAQNPRLRLALLADGAPELWNLMTAEFDEAALGRLVHQLIDLWHFLEKLGTAARAMGRDEDEAAALLYRWRLRLLNSSRATGRILDELRRSGQEWFRVGDSQPVHDAITYIENNEKRMDYASARRRGLPLGSGAVEATCKTLMAQRLKRSGSRWLHETGEHVVQLRALLLSDRWDAGMTALLSPLATAVKQAA
jgi:hypothetical protein